MTAKRAKRSVILSAILVGACATPPPVRMVGGLPAAFSAPRATAANDAVIGRNAAQLAALFGAPSRASSEGLARKLQFAGDACVLDAYLYPPAAGREPAVTHVDTRTTTGADIDRAQCVAALRIVSATPAG